MSASLAKFVPGADDDDDDDDDDDINLRPGNLSSNLPKGIWTC
jgi:hypothetical protein